MDNFAEKCTKIPLGLEASPVIFIGPTTTGKSSTVAEMAAIVGAEVITSDKYYLYAGPNFLLGLGMMPEELEGEVPHLVGCLPPEAKLPSTEEYVEMAAAKVDEIHARGCPVFIEGCSYSYAVGLMGRYGAGRVFRVGVPRQREIMNEKVMRAYDRLVHLGLYEETARALENGYEGTVPMGSIIYQATIEVLKNQIDRREARRLTIARWLGHIGYTEFRLEANPLIRDLNTPMGIVSPRMFLS